MNVGGVGTAARPATTTHPAHDAFVLLNIGYAALPIIAGIDKFFDKLGDWDMYLSPLAQQVTQLPVHTLMMMVGVIEIVAGLIVAFAPRVGAWIVTLWLWLIVINLLIQQRFYDIALRDLALSVGAIALARLACEYRPWPGRR
jgi:hypothetical protein